MPKHKSIGGRKSVRTKKAVVRKAKPIYNSDEDVPDETADSFHKDDIDIYNEQLEESSSDDGKGIPEARAPTREAVYDFSDSEEEEEMVKRLKKIEASVRRKQKGDSSESEEEVDEDANEGKTWGKKRGDFYGADVSTKVDLGVSSDDEAEARAEEKDARMMQQKLLAEIDESDYNMDMFMDTAADHVVDSSTSAPAADTPVEAAEIVQTDLSKLSEREKLRLLKKEYPEFINIVTDYKEQLVEYRDKVAPLLSLHKRGLLPDSNGLQLIRMKAQILLNYCMCCQTYLLLRAEKASLDAHPVIKRMVQFKQMLKEISEAERGIRHQIDHVLKKIEEGKEDELQTKANQKTGDKAKLRRRAPKATVTPSDTEPQGTKAKRQSKHKGSDSLVSEAAQISKKVKKSADTKKKRMQNLLDDEEDEREDKDVGQGGDMTAGEKEALEFYDLVRKRRRAGDVEEDDDIGQVEGGIDEDTNMAYNDVYEETDKRAITEEMQKNRGLTAKRPKHLKNPRIKNKLKYLKKKKIHKSIVPTVLTEMNRYSGESSGIRAGRIRSVQLS